MGGAERWSADPRNRGMYGGYDRRGHPWLFRTVRFAALSGRYGRRHRLAVDRLFADDGDRVLDLGCGPAPNTRALTEAVGPGGRVVGLDLRRWAVRETREEAARVGGPCSAVRGDPGSLPFADGTFDRAFSTLGARAVPNVRSAVAEVARVLRPGGRFVVLHAQPFPTLPLAFLGPFGRSVSVRTDDLHPDRRAPNVLKEWFDAVHVETFDGGSAFVATAELSG